MTIASHRCLAFLKKTKKAKQQTVFPFSLFQPTTANVWTPGSRRTRRRALCVNNVSPVKTQSSPSLSLRMTPEDAARRRARTARATLSALPYCGHPTRTPRPRAQGPTPPPPPPPLPSAWLPPHISSLPSWGTKTTTPQRRIRTRTPQTRMRSGTTLKTTRHSSSVAAE